MSYAAAPTTATSEQLSWRFPPTFWFANGAELLERAAYYGMFITLFRYLNNDIGFTTVQTGYISGTFAAVLYFLPTFMGIMADKIGFKQALLIAFALLTGGYSLLGAFQLKLTALAALTLVMFGGAIIKPVISGTVAKTSDSKNRARAMSIFYMCVNIGSFSGKSIAAPLNEYLGFQYINFYAAAMAGLGFFLVLAFYRNVDTAGTGKTVSEALRGLVHVLGNFRFLALIIIIGGFWAIQGQLYGAMPTYIERLLGKGYKPEWLANINPLVVVLLVVPITNLVRDFRPASAIGIGLFIIPFTALVVALAPFVQQATGQAIPIVLPSAALLLDLAGAGALLLAAVLYLRFKARRSAPWVAAAGLLLIAAGVFMHTQFKFPAIRPADLHPIVLTFIIGIALQGLAECFLSPKWLEFASKQAPPDEVGLYLGYSHLTTFFAWFFGFIIAGYLLAAFCPHPDTLSAADRDQWRRAVDEHYAFVLPPEAAGELRVDAPVGDDLRAAFAAQGLAIPPDARIRRPDGARPGSRAKPAADATEAAGGQASESGPWAIAIDGDEYRIERYKLESAERAEQERTVEHLVYAPTARPAEERAALPSAYANANYIWYAFAGIGIAAFLGLLTFKAVTERIDRARTPGPTA